MNFGARPDQPGAWLECDVQRVYRGLLGSVRYGRVGAIRSNQLHGVAQPAPVLLALLIVCRDYCCGYCQVCQFLEFANSVRVGRDRQGSVFCRNGMIRARNRDDLRFAGLLFRRQFRMGISRSRFRDWLDRACCRATASSFRATSATGGGPGPTAPGLSSYDPGCARAGTRDHRVSYPPGV